MRPISEARSHRAISTATWLMLLALLIVPVIAFARLTQVVDYRVMLGWLTIMSLTTFQLYWHDKRCAETRQWRVPEATLHFCEILGGWPAAFLAQRIFRHKTIKLSYQLTFWMIVTIHQCAAMAILLDDGSLRRGLDSSWPSTLFPQHTTSRPAPAPPNDKSERPIVVPGPAGRDRVR